MTEKSVLGWLEGREHELVELTRELVRTPSPNPPGDERQIAELVRQAMDVLGYTDVRTIARSQERPNVVGHVGSGRPTLLLNGHLDTKPAGDEAAWETSPWDPVVRDGRLYGLGSTDMKGAVAAMIYAGGALAAAGDVRGTVRVVLTADEENGSRFGAEWLAPSGEIEADAAVVGEPTGIRSGWEYLAVASRGFAAFTVTVRGTQMHSSLSDRLPSVNASVKMARVLGRFAESFRPSFTPSPHIPGGPTVNLGVVVSGGVYWGIYPGEARFGVDVRTVPGMTLGQLQADVEAFVDRLRKDDPELDLSVEWSPELPWFPGSAIDPDHPLVAAAQGAAEAVLGRDVPRGVMPAFTDGTHWALAGIPCIPALGPGLLSLAHRPNEWVAVREIIEAARIYALLALRYFASS